MTIDATTPSRGELTADALADANAGEVAAPPVPVVRSPADILRLAVAVTTLIVVLLVEWLFGGAVVGFVHDLLHGVDAFSDRFITAVAIVVRVTTIAFLAAGLAVAVVRGRWRLLGTVVIAGIAGAAVFAITDRLIDHHRPALVDLSDVAGPLTSASFPTATGLAIAAAVVTAAGPWLSRRYRRLGWVLTFGLAAVTFVASPVSARALAALVSGWAGGALAVVALGAPMTRPGREAVLNGLRAVGVPAATLEPASLDARGSKPYFGETTDGQPLFVKVLGRDERSADLLFRLYRKLLPRDLGDTRPFGNLRRAVEHEALASLTAASFGVRTPAVVALCDAEPGGVVLAYKAVAGRSLDRVEDEQIDDGIVAGVWAQLTLLRAHRLAHRDLRLANMFLDDAGAVWLIDFGFAELAASDLLLATDLAELTASLALKVGPARATAAATAAVGHDAVATALPRLQPGFLSGATRTALAQQPQMLEEIRSALGGSGSS